MSFKEKLVMVELSEHANVLHDVNSTLYTVTSTSLKVGFLWKVINFTIV